ncbi:uncharacterized protein LOC119190654 [Manduca sexta]|uniref:uncharacterized protein LOC119190654 n=1 Tax=Manduca sexta TaxID=7130 RepID=UPI00188FFD77|nr:uncharacterized protein LOC119190654 [Manduca sexta]
MAWQLVLLTLLSLGAVNYANLDCVLDFQNDFDTSNPLPIILRDNKLLNPDPNTCSVVLPEGSKILIGCPGDTNSIMYMQPHGRIDTGLKQLEASCNGGSNFISGNSLLDSFALKEISCKEQPKVTVRKTTKCGKDNQHQTYQCGYTIGNVFVWAFESCYDERLYIPSHVKYEIRPHTCTPAPTAPSGNILTGLLEGLLGIVLYILSALFNVLTSLVAQKARFIELFGTELADVYLRDDNLEPCYLANPFYFATVAEQSVTTHYVNLAPQWKSVTESLESLQQGVQNYVNQGQNSLTVYSGTIGVLTLPASLGSSRALYLVTFLGSNVCPVPQYFYKVVITDNGPLVFLISNSIAAVPSGVPFCTDLGSDAHSGISWNRKRSIDLCCPLEEFLKQANYLLF